MDTVIKGSMATDMFDLIGLKGVDLKQMKGEDRDKVLSTRSNKSAKKSGKTASRVSTSRSAHAGYLRPSSGGRTTRRPLGAPFSVSAKVKEGVSRSASAFGSGSGQENSVLFRQEDVAILREVICTIFHKYRTHVRAHCTG
jgi:hypothetical protein